jgi:hypothetical protein
LLEGSAIGQPASDQILKGVSYAAENRDLFTALAAGLRASDDFTQLAMYRSMPTSPGASSIPEAPAGARGFGKGTGMRVDGTVRYSE